MKESVSATSPQPIVVPDGWFMSTCAVAAGAILVMGRFTDMPLSLLGLEALLTIVGLFVLGSFRYQVHKNALTYGMLLVNVSTFVGLRTSAWHAEVVTSGLWAWVRHHLLSFHALDDLVHADTMLFILGLTLILQLFAMAQIAGYALGGCWTHIGSSQSVVAYAFIQRDVDERYTPTQWIAEMTPLLLKITGVIAALIYVESLFIDVLIRR